MGYRHKIGIMPKELHNKIKEAKSYKELYESIKGEGSYPNPTKLPSGDEYIDDYIGCYDITKEIYELGKYADDSYLKDYREEVFVNKDLVDRYNRDSAFYIIGKEGFKAIIKNYHDKILSYFQDLSNDEKGWKEYFSGKVYEWTPNDFGVNPYFLDEKINGDDVVRSWKYEYQIFELARLYKTIDWENNVVTITAW